MGLYPLQHRHGNGIVLSIPGEEVEISKPMEAWQYNLVLDESYRFLLQCVVHWSDCSVSVDSADNFMIKKLYATLVTSKLRKLIYGF